MKFYTNKMISEILPQVKPRTLIDWSEAKLLRPVVDADGTGSRRLYSYHNLIEICIIAELISYRISRDIINLILEGFNKKISKDRDNYDLVIVLRKELLPTMEKDGFIRATDGCKRTNFREDAAKVVFGETYREIDGEEYVTKHSFVGSAVIVSVLDMKQFVDSRL